jgi:hypothetical protein
VCASAGPYNTSYRNLRNHLKLAALEPLLSTEEPSANPVIPAALSAAAASVESDAAHAQHKGAVGKSPNCWASLCDVTACLEAPATNSSPAGYAIDAQDDACPLLPPLPSTARLLPYENFRATTIPFKAESAPFEVRLCMIVVRPSGFVDNIFASIFRSLQQCAIRTPAEYLDSLREYKESLAHIKAQVSSVVASPTALSSSASAPGAPTGGASPEERKRKQALASAAISKKFMVRQTTLRSYATEMLQCLF